MKNTLRDYDRILKDPTYAKERNALVVHQSDAPVFSSTTYQYTRLNEWFEHLG